MTTVREIEDILADTLRDCVREAVECGAEAVNEIALDVPKVESHGDYTTTIALRLAKICKRSPRDLAKIISDRITKRLKSHKLDRWISDVSVDGPGYINLRLTREALTLVLNEILLNDKPFKKDVTKESKKILLEFVSANPTGPLTVAHGRQAALGDALKRILRFCGHSVDAEYYNNDEGVQIELLGESLQAHYLTLEGSKAEFPEKGYKGEYLKDIAKKMLDDKVEIPKDKQMAKQFFSAFAADTIIKGIKDDLSSFEVSFDRFFSQKSLSESGQIEETLEALKSKNVLYEKDGALWLRSTDFGDDKDRVMIKSDKTYTYLTPDTAYHKNKFERGFDELITILGPDHHGYIARLKASQEALGFDSNKIRVLIAQLVTLYEGKKQVRMSTRAGEFVTLREIVNEVGKDAARFFFSMRKFDTHLDFDLELAKKESQDNPVFYIQYAHARIASIERLQQERKIEWDPETADFTLLDTNEELRALRALRLFPRIVESASNQLEPCVLIDYLTGLAQIFHQFYTKCRVVSEDEKLTQARLTIAFALKKAIRLGLDFFSVKAPEKM